MNYHHDIKYIGTSINEALQLEKLLDPWMRYDSAMLVTENFRPSIHTLSHGLPYSPLMVPSGTEFAMSQVMKLDASEVSLPALFCRANLSRFRTASIMGRKYSIPWIKDNCAIFGYETHVLMQPGSFALGHSASRMKKFFNQKNIECKLDISMMR